MQRISRVKIVLLCMFVLFFSGNLFAESDPVEKMEFVPLEVVLQDVLETNPDIIEAKGIYRATVSERSIAKSGYYPTIGAEVSAGPEVTDGYSTDYESEEYLATRAVIYARQNLFKGGETKNFVAETDARILAAAWDVVTIANRVYLDVVEAYINVLKMRKLLQISGENVMTQEQILGQVSEKAEAGFTKISDLANSKARLSLAKGNYISAQQDLNHALVKFHRQFGRILTAEQFVAPEPSFKFPETVEDNVDFAFRNHPALKVAEYNIHARKSGYERSKGAYWPTLDLELQGEFTNDFDGNDGDEVQCSAMLKLGYIFWDGGVRSGEKGKKYQYLLKEYQRAYIERRNVNQAVRLAWNIDQAEKAKKGFLDDHVVESNETLEAFKEEYHLGKRTLLDILNMENEYSAAKVANAESIYNDLTAYYRISQATGVLIHEFDTALLKELELPTEKPYDLEPYEKDILNPDRDTDVVKDTGDQCDNSAQGSQVQPFGCTGDVTKKIGYSSPDSLSPYIIPEGAALNIDKTKDEQSIDLNTIHFHYNSAELTDEALLILEAVAKQLNDAADYAIEVIGHTCDLGSNEYNQSLSEARAASVVAELKRQGVKAERLSSSGRGEIEPVADNSTEDGKAKNRRTEFKLTR